MDAATQRRLALLEAEVGALRRQRRQRQTWRRRVPLALVALLVALVPLGIAAAGFNDLNPGSPHNANIQAIADAGITKGCDPGVSYCPNGLVTREEMASFLARTAGIGGNAPVVNAKTAQTAQTATMATNAQNATNAAQLGGQPASAYALKGDIPSGGGASATTEWYSFFNLTAPDTSVVLVDDPGQYGNDGFPNQAPRTIVTDPAVFGTHDLLLPLEVPTALRVSAVRICYATPAFSSPGLGARIDRTALVKQGEASTTQLSPDNTVRQSHALACYDLTLSQPVTADGALYLRLRVNFTNQGNGESVVLYGARLTLVP